MTRVLLIESVGRDRGEDMSRLITLDVLEVSGIFRSLEMRKGVEVTMTGKHNHTLEARIESLRGKIPPVEAADMQSRRQILLHSVQVHQESQ